MDYVRRDVTEELKEFILMVQGKELDGWQLNYVNCIMDYMDSILYGTAKKAKKDPSHTHSINNLECKPICYNSLAPTPYPAGFDTVPCQKQENDMNYGSATACISVDAAAPQKDERRFLRSRLEDAFYTKKDALKVKFGLRDDEAPASFEDFLARINAGKYTIDDKDAKKKTWNPTAYIRWRAPDLKEDQEGYDAAKATLKAAYDKAEEDIRILTPTEGLAALRAFKDITVQ